LYDNNSHHTHFTGFMLQEEIVASLWWFCFDYPKLIFNWSENNILLCNIYGRMV
jgi:hypothetical protein